MGKPDQRDAEPGAVVSVHLRSDPALRDSVIRWIGAFPYAVKNLLRGTDGLGPIADELPGAEIVWLPKKPSILRWQSRSGSPRAWSKPATRA